MDVLYIINYAVEYRVHVSQMWHSGKEKKIAFILFDETFFKSRKTTFTKCMEEEWVYLNCPKKTCPEKASARCVCSIAHWNTAKQALHSRTLRLKFICIGFANVYMLRVQQIIATWEATRVKGARITVVHCAKLTECHWNGELHGQSCTWPRLMSLPTALPSTDPSVIAEPTHFTRFVTLWCSQLVCAGSATTTLLLKNLTSLMCTAQTPG